MLSIANTPPPSYAEAIQAGQLPTNYQCQDLAKRLSDGLLGTLPLGALQCGGQDMNAKIVFSQASMPSKTCANADGLTAVAATGGDCVWFNTETNLVSMSNSGVCGSVLPSKTCANAVAVTATALTDGNCVWYDAGTSVVKASTSGVCDVKT